MAQISQSQKQRSSQIQKQQQRLSHLQIQALKFLEMGSRDLSDELYRLAAENPAIEITEENAEAGFMNNYDRQSGKKGSSLDADRLQRSLENTEDRSETLQAHLMHQLNSMQLSQDEYELSQKLIYNLDKNGFYGTTLSPSALLDRRRPNQNAQLLEECMNRIQKMDPVGTCVKSAEESLYVQAKLSDNPDPLVLFILNGHLDLLNPPEPAKILTKLNDYKEQWHKKAFAGEIILDKVKLTEESVSKVLKKILQLNPLPAQGYVSDTSAEYEKPDIVLTVKRVNGYLSMNDYEKGLVSGDDKCHFQIKYASGVIPEIRLSKEFVIDKENYQKAQELINCLAFRESSIVLQGCAIVNAQRGFFLNGTEQLKALTRKQVAQELGIHESTVSRMAGKKGSKYIQTEWGLFPASFFYSSGVKSTKGETKISAQAIKNQIQKLLSEYSDSEGSTLSDEKLTRLLNAQGIKIARRTVAKYRSQAGIKNSYDRKDR